MNDYELKKKSEFILNGQLLGCILYIISVLISILIIINEKLKLNNDEVFFTQEKTQNINIKNHLFILLIILLFFYLNYESFKLSKELERDTCNQEIQLIVSLLSILIGLISLYISFRPYLFEDFL